VRYMMEPIGTHPDTHSDPLNQQALKEQKDLPDVIVTTFGPSFVF
jgi:hypothetical protein